MTRKKAGRKNSNRNVILLDGYVDEPSCLGVPPYISPYARYTYGALLHLGFHTGEITYYTVDGFRESNALMSKNVSKSDDSAFTDYDLMVIIAGTTVPGHYMGGKPIAVTEIEYIATHFSGTVLLGGPIALCPLNIKGIDQLMDETCALGLYEYFSRQTIAGNALRLIETFAELGAALLQEHPSFPNLVCELETYRGCPRQANCKFCSEALKQVRYARDPDDVIAEVRALYEQGGRYFRVGAQTDLLLYGAQYSMKAGAYKPNPLQLDQLYSGIRKSAPGLKVLHMDNVNPSTIAAFPRECEEIIATIVTHNTPGDTAAFGLETSDPIVLEKNNIGTTPEETFDAIRLMNRVGGVKAEGLYKLLPGINFLYGLQGERPETYEMNFRFLKNVLDAGLLLRRINLRQVRDVGAYKGEKLNAKRFKAHKEKVNREINLPMLRQVFPPGTVLKGVLTEKREGQITFGRQLGTYPILVGIPGEHPLGTFFDVKVIDHGYRSITGLPYPFHINRASLAELQALPGIGKKRASWLKLNQPIRDFQMLAELLDESVNVRLLDELIDTYQ